MLIISNWIFLNFYKVELLELIIVIICLKFAYNKQIDICNKLI